MLLQARFLDGDKGGAEPPPLAKGGAAASAALAAPKQYTFHASVLKTVAEAFGVTAWQDVSVHGPLGARRAHETAVCDYITFDIRDQFVSRADIWRFKESVVGEAIWRGKSFALGGVRATVRDARKLTLEVTAGVIGESTRFIFRSRSTRIFWLVQMSAEMWEHAPDGELFFDKVGVRERTFPLSYISERSLSTSLGTFPLRRSLLRPVHQAVRQAAALAVGRARRAPLALGRLLLAHVHRRRRRARACRRRRRRRRRRHRRPRAGRRRRQPQRSRAAAPARGARPASPPPGPAAAPAARGAEDHFLMVLENEEMVNPVAITRALSARVRALPRQLRWGARAAARGGRGAGARAGAGGGGGGPRSSRTRRPHRGQLPRGDQRDAQRARQALLGPRPRG